MACVDKKSLDDRGSETHYFKTCVSNKEKTVLDLDL